MSSNQGTNSRSGNTPSDAAVKELKLRLGSLKDSPSFVSPVPRSQQDDDDSRLHSLRQDIFKDSQAPSPSLVTIATPNDSPYPHMNDESISDSQIIGSDNAAMVKILNGKLKISQRMYDQIVDENLKVLRAKERIEQELRDANKRLEEREGQSSRERSEIQSFEAQFKPLCEQLISLRKEVAAQEKQLKESDKVRKTLDKEVKNLKADLELSEAELKLSRAETGRLEAQKRQLAEVGALKAKVTELERQVQVGGEELVVSLRENHKKECDEYEKEVTELKGRCSDLEGELAKQRGEVQQAGGKIKELEGVGEGLASELEGLQEQYGEVQDRIRDAEERAARLAAQNDSLVVELPESFRIKLEALHDEVLEVQDEGERREGALRRKIQRRDDEILRLREMWRGLLVSHPDPGGGGLNEEAEAELRRMNKDVKGLNERLGLKEREVEELVGMVSMLRMRLMLANWRRPRYEATLRARIQDGHRVEGEGAGGGVDPTLFVEPLHSRSPRVVMAPRSLTPGERASFSPRPAASQQPSSGMVGGTSPERWGGEAVDAVGQEGDAVAQEEVGRDIVKERALEEWRAKYQALSPPPSVAAGGRGPSVDPPHHSLAPEPQASPLGSNVLAAYPSPPGSSRSQPYESLGYDPRAGMPQPQARLGGGANPAEDGSFSDYPTPQQQEQARRSVSPPTDGRRGWSQSPPPGARSSSHDDAQRERMPTPPHAGGRGRSPGADRGGVMGERPSVRDYREKAAKAEKEIERLQQQANRRIEEAKREADQAKQRAEEVINQSNQHLQRRHQPHQRRPIFLSPASAAGSSPLPTPPLQPPQHQIDPYAPSANSQVRAGGLLGPASPRETSVSPPNQRSVSPPSDSRSLSPPGFMRQPHPSGAHVAQAPFSHPSVSNPYHPMIPPAAPHQDVSRHIRVPRQDQGLPRARSPEYLLPWEQQEEQRSATHRGFLDEQQSSRHAGYPDEEGAPRLM